MTFNEGDKIISTSYYKNYHPSLPVSVIGYVRSSNEHEVRFTVYTKDNPELTATPYYHWDCSPYFISHFNTDARSIVSRELLK